MPRQKQTESRAVGLPHLAPCQARYVEARAGGASIERATMAAHPQADGWARVTRWRTGCKLEHHPSVVQWLAACRTAAVDRGAYSVAAHLHELDHIARQAQANGNYGAATNAIVAKGKAAGLYVERYADVTRSTDAVAMLEAIEQLCGPDARRTAARRMVELRLVADDAIEGETTGATQDVPKLPA